ncbi:MAG: VCBS repeat-containing protein, partial [bacterium]
MIKHLLTIGLLAIAYCNASEFKEYSFIEGSLERVTTSDIPGTKWMKNPKSLKLSPQYPKFQRREWEPLPSEMCAIARPELGDIDNDGDYDLLVSGGGNGTVSVFENTGTKYNPEFTLKKYIYLPKENGFETYEYLTLGDINQDGLLDILVCYKKEENGSYTYNLYAYKGTEPFVWQRWLDWDVTNIPITKWVWGTLSPELGDLD